jgi:molybdopterin synthase catalytic subunit
VIVLTPDSLDPWSVARSVGDPEHGGLALFVGTTRRESGERDVAELCYEAYEELCLHELGLIASEAAARFGARVALAHRVGAVAVGEPSVVVAASAPHRAEAFAACRYAIDELKARAPIWKRTVYADGHATWRDGRAPVVRAREAEGVAGSAASTGRRRSPATP